MTTPTIQDSREHCEAIKLGIRPHASEYHGNRQETRNGLIIVL
jgi:hypothetical protein